jgi:hypothetical protein
MTTESERPAPESRPPAVTEPELGYGVVVAGAEDWIAASMPFAFST